ncbi:MAG: SMP-30/gluconolactonase/LRE family protein [Thermodesulfobacteriota bacterium]
MRWRKIIILIAGLVILTVAGFVVKTMYRAGEFKTLQPYSRWDCRKITGLTGSEDITLNQSTGLAFISAVDFRARSIERKYPQGAVYGYDLAAADPTLVNLTADFKKGFFPHGLGLYAAPDGKTSLFVVNHQPQGSRIEVFDYQAGRLVHRRTVTDPLLHSPNDVTPVGPDRFYVTNDHGYTSKAGRTLEDFLQLAQAQILYYDGRGFQVVAEGLAYANGINISPDGERVYVAETVGRRIKVFRRNQDSGRLTLEASIDVDAGVDNIEVDRSGRLWIGAHPKLLSFVRYSKDPARRSPSQVIKAEVIPGGGLVASTEFLDLGEALSGSSVAAVFQDYLLIGSVFDDCFLLCRPRTGVK